MIAFGSRLSAHGPEFRVVSRILLAVSSLLPGIFIPACAPLHEDSAKERLVVCAMLDQRRPHQTIVVDKSYSPDSVAPETVGVRGARVKLWRENSTDTVYMVDSSGARFRPGFYQDTLTGHPLLPCSAYRFRVEWRHPISGREYSGQAGITVPDTFRVTSPTPGETLSLVVMRSASGETLGFQFESPVFTWRLSRTASAYLMAIGHLPWLEDSSLFWIPIVTTDTFEDLIPVFPGVFEDTGRYRVKIFAWDRHTYEQYITLNQPAMDSIGAEVWAVLGAQTVDSVEVYYQRRDSILPSADP
jgi:hypothetical protein